MGMAAPIYHTAKMVRALPDDGNRYEVVYGELLVTPAPRLSHQALLGRLFIALAVYLQREEVGHVFFSPADISWGPDTLVQPDLFVVPLEDARTGDWARLRRLLLAAEVLSPSSARSDRFTKRRLYQDHGVDPYWIVDGEARAVEIWTPAASSPVIAREALTWHPEGATEPFRIELSELFRPI